MSEIRRYKLCQRMEPSDIGPWCFYADVAPLEARIMNQADELKVALEGRIALRAKIAEQADEIVRFKDMQKIDQVLIDEAVKGAKGYKKIIESLEAELAEAKKEIERVANLGIDAVLKAIDK